MIHTLSKVLTLTAAEWEEARTAANKASWRWFTLIHRCKSPEKTCPNTATMTSQLFNHTATEPHRDIFHTPEVYAASDAISHSLTALNQDSWKRLHSSRLSLTCRDGENQKTKAKPAVIFMVSQSINEQKELNDVFRFDGGAQTWTNLCTLADDHLPDCVLFCCSEFSQWIQISFLESYECVHSLMTDRRRTYIVYI